MEIQIDANFKLTGIFEPPWCLSLDKDKITLRELLKHLDSLWETVHILEGEDLSDDIEELLLNGQHFFTLPGHLNIPLKNRDHLWIELYMAPLGGG
jgi:hypothetical protein